LNWIVAVVTENQKLKSTLFLNPSAVFRASNKPQLFRLNGSTLLIIRRRRRCTPPPPPHTAAAAAAAAAAAPKSE
jgi:hypothetical protein